MKKTRNPIEGHQLYYFSACPYCIAVRFALWKRGLKIALKDIMTNQENNAELIAGGGKAQVPCLRIEHEDGRIEWMYESGDIIRYVGARLTAQG